MGDAAGQSSPSAVDQIASAICFEYADTHSLITALFSLDEMENASISKPMKTKHDLKRSVLADLSASESRFNLSSQSTNEKHSSTAAAANRFTGLGRGNSRRSLHRHSLSNDSSSQHSRQWSKSAKNRLLQRSITGNRESLCEDTSLVLPTARCDLGDALTPITHFRPQLWKYLDSSRDIVNLDLFWPQRLEYMDQEREEGEEDGKHRHEGGGDGADDSDGIDAPPGIFPLQGLRPLCEFRNLRSLRLGGMLQSYQPYIWRVCWLNPKLEDLFLEMALEPSINDGYRSWAPIDGTWRGKTLCEAQTDYLGQQEDGSLSDKFGSGEYLDKNAMASARTAVSPHGVNLRYLPVVKLVLAGFVVDAGPFFRWFNPMKLRQIEFKHGCFDAGFALPSHMVNSVTVLGPRNLREGHMVMISRVSPQDIKRIIPGKKESLSERTEIGMRPKMNSLLTKNWFPSTRTSSLRSRKAKKDRRPQLTASTQPIFSSRFSATRDSFA